MRRQVPMRMDGTTPARSSSYSFERPMPRTSAASRGVSSSFSMVTPCCVVRVGLFTGTAFCR